MLLSFSCKNFKSFKNEAVLSMVPEKRLSELRYSILNEKIDGKNLSALSTSVVYGPNAAGKTSLINALSCFKRIVLRGNIRDEEFDILHDRVSNAMRLVPFAFSDDSEPVSFDISFTTDMHKFRYVHPSPFPLWNLSGSCSSISEISFSCCASFFNENAGFILTPSTRIRSLRLSARHSWNIRSTFSELSFICSILSDNFD